MPELMEQMYCSQQIVIPPKFPYILKKYCKAAIKTQPYDLLRWSFEYFRALAEHRLPPVKLRLEYPIYSSEGGLTRGCLRVLANQLVSMTDVPMPVLKRAWQGFCLDPIELRRILCLCEVYNRADSVPFFHFIAVAGGLLTKCLTHTMILLCESLTKEPDGGSAAIPLKDFLKMYRFLAAIDASCDVKYYNGYREGQRPEETTTEAEMDAEESVSTDVVKDKNKHKYQQIDEEEDDFWERSSQLFSLSLVGDKVDLSARLSMKAARPLIGELERSPSVERAKQIERENYLAERKGKAKPSEEVERKLKQLSGLQVEMEHEADEVAKDDKHKDVEKEKEDDKHEISIHVFDEDGNEISYEIYGDESSSDESIHGTTTTARDAKSIQGETVAVQGTKSTLQDQTVSKIQPGTIKSVMLSKSQPAPMHGSEEDIISDPVMRVMLEAARAKEERILDLEETFADLAIFVDKFNSANYDLGMVAGRQMSTTSGEFIVQSIEKEILAYIDDQIAILPDPDLKKKKAKPEEVEMVRGILETFMDENMDIIVPEVEEVEEEEQPIPDIIMVYAVPGIGPVVDSEIVTEFEDYAREACKVQADVIMPRNLRHYLCPPMEMFVEHTYQMKKEEKKEEAPVGGGITD